MKKLCSEKKSYHTNISYDGSSAYLSELSRQGYRKAIFLFAIFIFVVVFRAAVIERIIVNGNSMYPTLADSDVCIARKFDVEPQRYDIVIVKVEGQTIIKRVIGLPGEIIHAADGTIYIDGNPVSEEYDFYTEYIGVLENPYMIGENEYFIMGDNRNKSYDSREFGSVGIEDIKGIVIFRIYPFNGMDIYSR